MRESKAPGRVPAALNLPASTHHDTFPGLGTLSPTSAAHPMSAREAPRDYSHDLATPHGRSLGFGAIHDRFQSAPSTAQSATFAAFAPPGSANPALFLPSDHSGPRAHSADESARLSPSFPRRPVSSQETRMHDLRPGYDTGSGPNTPLLSSQSPGARTPRSASLAVGPMQRMPLTTAGAAASDQRTQLQVRNLPYSVRWQDVKDLFRRTGTVLRADVHLTADKRSCGTGSVLFATEEDALRAIDTLHGYTWQGRVLDVQLERDAPPSNAPHRSSEASTPRTGEATPAARTPNSALFPGFDSLPAPPTRFPGFAPRRDGPELPWPPMGMPAPMPNQVSLPFPGRVLFVGNLPFHCQWQDLKDLFRAAGNIQRADVALNGDGRSRGFGTVLFASPEDAQNAVRLYHGYEYNGRVLKVHFDRLAHYGPSNGMVPTDPLQYTAAFSSHGPAPPDVAHAPIDPTLVDGELLEGPGEPWGEHGAGADAHRPGHIALPPLSMTNPAAATPGIGLPMTPGMPGFMMRPVLDTPPLYPHLLSPGTGFGSPLSGNTPMFPGINPYMNAAPGAPLDFVPNAYGGYGDVGQSAFFPQPSNLPPTPHWSQPARTRVRASSLLSERNEGMQQTPGAKREPVNGEYPFPALGPEAQDEKEGAEAPPAKDNSTVQSSTKELTEAIAKLSVHGTARSKRGSADAGDSRDVAEKALSRLREGLAAPDDAPQNDTKQ